MAESAGDHRPGTPAMGCPGARETVTGERVLRFLGHLITSRIDEKRSTYPSIVSN